MEPDGIIEEMEETWKVPADHDSGRFRSDRGKASVGVFFATLMWAASEILPQWRFSHPVLTLLALMVAGSGVVTELWSVWHFIRFDTTINPLKPHRSKRLVSNGPYRFSRNPMYLGLLLLLTGFGIWLGNPLALLVLPAFLMYVTEFQIKPEEEALLKLFGDEFNDFQRQVRRWL